jgi:hypothetical protein
VRVRGRRRAVLASCIGLAAALGISSAGSAENFGAGLPPDQDDRCTEESHASQCTANNGNHGVMIVTAMNNNLETALINSVADDYDDNPNSDTDITAIMSTNVNTADVWAAVTDGQNPREHGWGTCIEGAMTGDQGFEKWCKPQAMVFNTDFAQEWNNDPGLRRWVVCHEIGHTLGLRHTNGRHSSLASCMLDRVEDFTNTWPTVLASFDKRHLRNCYPHDPDPGEVAADCFE